MSEILFESFSNMKCLDNSQMDYKHFKYYIIDKIERSLYFFSQYVVFITIEFIILYDLIQILI